MQRPSRGLMTRTLLLQHQIGEVRIDEVERRLESMVLAVTSTLRSFGNPPGRKVMLLMSGGWPHSPAKPGQKGIQEVTARVRKQKQDLSSPCTAILVSVLEFEP